MKFCKNCSSQYPDNCNVCSQCGCALESVPVQQNVAQAPVQPQYAAPQVPVQPQYTAPQAPVQQSAPAKKSGMSKATKKIVGVLGGVVLLGVVFAVLVFTHVICLSHDFMPATCTEGEKCSYCGKTQGDAAGHQWKTATCQSPKTCTVCNQKEGETGSHVWIAATCTTPETCSECGKTQGSVPGHTEGNWEATKAATLMSKGEEALKCTTCGENIKTRTTEVKTPGVSGSSFNFTDEEFIPWLESIDDFTISKNTTDVELDPDETAYFINVSDGGTCVMLLVHDSKGNICAMSFFRSDKNTTGDAIAIMIGLRVDRSFSSDKAVSDIVSSDMYVSTNATVMRFSMDGGGYYTMLAPTQYFLDNYT